MAFPASFDESNAVLGRPKGMTDDECTPLSVLITEDTAEQPVVVSCWKLTAEEMAEIQRTGRIWLGIYGQTMPPVWVVGERPF